VSPDKKSAASHQETRQLLSWENLASQSPWVAFRQSLMNVLLSPGRFFQNMATSGGLREPLTFCWLIVGSMLLMSFPLALSYFLLTAPDPVTVSPADYNACLLAPRITGFLTVLLPVVLVLYGVVLLVEGSIFHLGARLFGARNWEGSVSIWAYARGAGLAPMAAAEALGCVVSIGCYLLALALPGSRAGFASAAQSCLFVLLIVGGGLGVLVQLVALILGCIKSFRLGTAQGAAAALCGLLLLVVIAVGIRFGFVKWGLKGGFVTVGSSIVLLVIVLLLHMLHAAEHRWAEAADSK